MSDPRTAIDQLAEAVDRARALADELATRPDLDADHLAYARAWRLDLEDLHGQILEYIDEAAP